MEVIILTSVRLVSIGTLVEVSPYATRIDDLFTSVGLVSIGTFVEVSPYDYTTRIDDRGSVHPYVCRGLVSIGTFVEVSPYDYTTRIDDRGSVHPYVCGTRVDRYLRRSFSLRLYDSYRRPW